MQEPLNDAGTPQRCRNPQTLQELSSQSGRGTAQRDSHSARVFFTSCSSCCSFICALTMSRCSTQSTHSRATLLPGCIHEKGWVGWRV